MFQSKYDKNSEDDIEGTNIVRKSSQINYSEHKSSTSEEVLEDESIRLPSFLDTMRDKKEKNNYI
jgi:hypothetical protein